MKFEGDKAKHVFNWKLVLRNSSSNSSEAHQQKLGALSSYKLPWTAISTFGIHLGPWDEVNFHLLLFWPLGFTLVSGMRWTTISTFGVHLDPWNEVNCHLNLWGSPLVYAIKWTVMPTIGIHSRPVRWNELSYQAIAKRSTLPKLGLDSTSNWTP